MKRTSGHYPGMGEFKIQCIRETPAEVLSLLVDTPDKVFYYWEAHIRSDPRYNPDVEQFWVLMVNTRRRPWGHVVGATGTTDTLLVTASVVFREAIIAGAAAIVLMHNHPSGDPAPSEADIRITRDLVKCGELLKVQVLDHVIVGSVKLPEIRQWTSLRELGYVGY